MEQQQQQQHKQQMELDLPLLLLVLMLKREVEQTCILEDEQLWESRVLLLLGVLLAHKQ